MSDGEASAQERGERDGVRALSGLQVIETGEGVAVPLAAGLLADFGAEVIKVEPPGGDRARDRAGFAVWNRGKRSVALDLDRARDRKSFDRLLAGADVWLGADRVRRHGYRVDEVQAAHRRLVILEAPPYPEPVPWAGGQESNGLLAALTGIALRQSSYRGGPVEPVYPHLLYAHGVWAAACVVAALVERQRSGLGQRVTAHGVHGMMVAATGFLAFDPERPEPPPAVGPGGPNPFYTRYACGDGAWLFLGSLTTKFQLIALHALGADDLLAEDGVDGDPLRLLQPDRRDSVRSLFAEAFGSRPRDEWLAVLAEAGCPAGPLESPEAWLDHPQIEAIGMRLELDDPERGPTVMPGIPVRLSATPGTVAAPAPQLGEHEPRPKGTGRRSGGSTSTPACGPDVPDPPEDARGPLAGTRVLDLGMILAGPYTGHLLAELGCDVIKVEPPAGDSFRKLGFTYNRGMRGLALDLSVPEGRAVLARLVARSDVVIENYRAAVAERLGVDRETLRRGRRDLISVGIRGFGSAGPLASAPGFDPILQAASGMMVAQGGDDEPVVFTVPYIDATTAALSVLGVCVALLHRSRCGEGQHVSTSLAAAATLLQSGELVRYEGRPPVVRGGADFLGPSLADRFYEVSDGWVRVAAERHSGSETNGEPLDDEGELARRLLGLRGEEAVRWLTSRGVPAALARRHDQLPEDARLAEDEVLHRHARPDGTGYYTAGRYARFSRTQRTGVLTAPGVGEHSSEVLREAGFSAAEIGSLLDKGVVVDGRSMAPPDFDVPYR